MRYLALLALAACTGTRAPDATATACQRALAGLQADHDAGLSCEAAKVRALVAEPGCPLSFHCKDAGP